MVISIRVPWINHKWTGIFSTVLILFHWLGEKVPEWLVQSGIIPDPGELTDGSGFSDLEINLFQSGVVLVEWTFYVLIILVIIALVKKIPYRVFRKTHKVFPVVFLVVAYHGATAQLKEHWLGTSAGYLLLLLVSLGVVSAIICLFQSIGRTRKFTATISDVNQNLHSVVDIQLSTKKSFLHQPGQYAFLRFAHDKEPHPFSIASSGDDVYSLRFLVKPLGDFTKNLGNQIYIGQEVEIEGPYGEFFHLATQSEMAGRREIWIAGGIGITPFISRLEKLANSGATQQPIDFWYSTRGDYNILFPDNLEHLCQQAGVNLHHLNSVKKKHLTADMVFDSVGSFENVSIWFCGPPAFAECLLKRLSVCNFDKRYFYYDNFNMR